MFDCFWHSRTARKRKSKKVCLSNPLRALLPVTGYLCLSSLALLSLSFLFIHVSANSFLIFCPPPLHVQYLPSMHVATCVPLLLLFCFPLPLQPCQCLPLASANFLSYPLPLHSLPSVFFTAFQTALSPKPLTLFLGGLNSQSLRQHPKTTTLKTLDGLLAAETFLTFPCKFS